MALACGQVKTDCAVLLTKEMKVVNFASAVHGEHKSGIVISVEGESFGEGC